MFGVRMRTLALLTAALLMACGGSTQQEESTSGNGGFAGGGGASQAGAAGGGGASQAGAAGTGGLQDAGPIDSGADVVTQDTGVSDVSVEPDTGIADGGPTEASLFDQAMPDVALGDGATAQTCYDCTTDKCHDEVAACDKDPKCQKLLTCLFVDQCWGGPNGVQMSCAMGCATKAGVSSYTDPAVQTAMTAGKCTGNNCKTECGM